MKKLLCFLLAMIMLFGAMAVLGACGNTKVGSGDDVDKETNEKDSEENDADDEADTDADTDADADADTDADADSDGDVTLEAIAMTEEDGNKLLKCYRNLYKLQTLRVISNETGYRSITGMGSSTMESGTGYEISQKDGFRALFMTKSMVDGKAKPDETLYFDGDFGYSLIDGEVNGWEEENDMDTFLYNYLLGVLITEEIDVVVERLVQAKAMVTRKDGLTTIRLDDNYVTIMKTVLDESSYEEMVMGIPENAESEGSFFSVTFSDEYITELALSISVKYTVEEQSVEMDVLQTIEFISFNDEETVVEKTDWVSLYEEDEVPVEYPLSVPLDYDLMAFDGLYFVIPEDWVGTDNTFQNMNGSSLNVQAEKNSGQMSEIDSTWFKDTLIPELEAQGLAVQNPSIKRQKTNGLDVLVLNYDLIVEQSKVQTTQYILAPSDQFYVLTIGIVSGDSSEVCSVFLDYLMYLGR